MHPIPFATHVREKKLRKTQRKRTREMSGRINGCVGAVQRRGRGGNRQAAERAITCVFQVNTIVLWMTENVQRYMPFYMLNLDWVI